DPADLVRSRERPMRLHVAERPSRGQLGESGDAGVLGYDRLRILRRRDEDVEGQRPIGRREDACGARQIESAQRLMDEQSPAVSADEPLNRHTPAVRPKLIAALTIPCRDDRSFAIELRAAFAEAKYWSRAERKRESRIVGAKREMLHR